MISRWGPIPEPAWAKARGAYGSTVDEAYALAVDLLRTPAHLANCMEGLAIEADLTEEILAAHF